MEDIPQKYKDAEIQNIIDFDLSDTKRFSIIFDLSNKTDDSLKNEVNKKTEEE